MTDTENTSSDAPSDFIRVRIHEDLAGGVVDGLITRFPPEPNGYLHIGHAKSICVNFGLGLEFSGRTYMRFDDTNPEKEEQEYIDSIKACAFPVHAQRRAPRGREKEAGR